MERFWEKGFFATSMQDLVDHLGINRASLYNAFPGGKEELFQAAFQLYIEEYSFDSEQVKAQLETGSVKDFLRQFFQQALEELQTEGESKGCFVTNTTCEMSGQFPALRLALQRHMDKMVDFFTTIIELGQDRGEIKSHHPPRSLAKHLFTFVNGLKAIAKIEPDLNSLQQAVDIELAYVFNG